MTAPWVNDTWLAIDTETTGVDVFTDRIVEVAAVELHPDGTIGETYTAIVNPGVEIPEGAIKVHGITNARAADEGIHPASAVASVAARIFAHGHRPVLMYNAPFDWTLLVSESERHGIDFPVGAPVLDPLTIDRGLRPEELFNRKLVQVAQHYAVEYDETELHGALADALLAGRVMRAILQRHPQVGDRMLAGMDLRQKRHHERWRLAMVDRRRSQGAQNFHIDPGWPLLTRIDRGGLPAPLTIVPESATGAAAAETREEAAVAGAPAASTTAADPAAPKPTRPALTPKDIATLAGHVFRKDYDAAPHGDKTKALARLRHATTWLATGGRTGSLEGLPVDELLIVDRWLRHIRDGRVAYATDPEGVTFVLLATGEEHAITWAHLEHNPAA